MSVLPDHIRSAISEYIPLLGDWLELDMAYRMAKLIKDVQPELVVEIGTFQGQSLITMAFALRDNHKGVIVGIDPWRVADALEGDNDPQNDDWWKNAINLNETHRKCMQAIWDHHLEEWVVIVRAASQHAYKLFPNNIDVLYIDGNHSEVASSRDAELYVPRVRSGGWVMADDCEWATTKKMQGIIDSMCDPVSDHKQHRIWRKR